MKQTDKKKGGVLQSGLFVLTLLLTAAVLLLRGYQSIAQNKPQPVPTPTPMPTVMPTEIPTPSPRPTPVPTATPSSEPSAAACPAPPKEYTPQTYAAVSDIVYICRELGAEAGKSRLDEKFAELELADAELAALWQEIIDYASMAAGEGFVMNSLPEALPEDDSLCIAVLGFQLNYDGSMAPELEKRCETALAAAEKYPKACIALTGGGTAPGKRDITEAGVMADWFVSRGIDSSRLIIEDRSMTTDQNARYTCELICGTYPRIKSILLVSSDYHVPLGCTMFETAALLYAYEMSCPAPYSVIANLGCAAGSSTQYSGIKNIMRYVWTLTDPHY